MSIQDNLRRHAQYAGHGAIPCQDMEHAAWRIDQLEKACALVRKELSTHYNDGAGWMAEFQKLAFPNEESGSDSGRA